MASINNTILHNLNRNQRTNDLSTAPPINQPQPDANLMTGLAAAGRQAETEQIQQDREFAGFQQQREVGVSDAKKKDLLIFLKINLVAMSQPPK